VEPFVVGVVVVDTCVECSSVVGFVAPSGPAVPVSLEVAHFMRVLSGAEPLATLQVVAHVERPDLPHPSIVIQIDMLVWHLFKLRLNRDYCALSYNESFCPVYGPLPKPAVFISRYLSPRQSKGRVLKLPSLLQHQAVRSHRLSLLLVCALIAARRRVVVSRRVMQVPPFSPKVVLLYLETSW